VSAFFTYIFDKTTISIRQKKSFLAKNIFAKKLAKIALRLRSGLRFHASDFMPRILCLANDVP